MFKCNKGVNFGGWLSQSCHLKEHYDTFIVESDFKRVKDLGFDHVRIPVDYELIEDEDGSYKNWGFSYIEKCILWSKKYGLNMILDLHRTFGFAFDRENTTDFFYNPKKKDRFLALWKQFAYRYAKYSDFLTFELLNEVVEGKVINEWNELIIETIKLIRSYSKDIPIIIGGVYYNSVSAVKYLPSFDDKNIVYTFHCYEPILFTHQGAYWVKGMPEDYRLKYPVSIEKLQEDVNYLPKENAVIFDEYTKEQLENNFFETIFKEALDYAKKNGVQLYCGEYGVIDLADTESALNWYRDINNVFKKFNIGRAVWNYKEKDFGIIDDHYKDVFEKLVDVL